MNTVKDLCTLTMYFLKSHSFIAREDAEICTGTGSEGKCAVQNFGTSYFYIEFLLGYMKNVHVSY